MTPLSMRKVFSRDLSRAKALTPRTVTSPETLRLFDYSLRWPTAQPSRRLANVRDDRDFIYPQSFPSSTFKVQQSDTGDKNPPNKRTLQLGKTVQTLHDRLPTLLASPLPQDVLSPQISLHLFPSTHPHLPTVTGRLSYTAALWTAPITWGRVPVVGNVRLIILSERMINSSTRSTAFTQPHAGVAPSTERLIVRWKTCGKTQGRGMGARYQGIGGSGDQVDKITEFLGGDARDDEEFTGLFVFEFDHEGRLCKHTIEHVQQGGNWEKMTRVVSVTDWLLGLARGRGQAEPQMALGFCKAPVERYDNIRRSPNERG